MKKDRPIFCQSGKKAVIGRVVIGVQKLLPLEAEIFCSYFKPLDEAFGRMRDGMISEHLKLIYFPLPKSACTLFATFIALNSNTERAFDPQKQGVHQFRYREKELQLRNMALVRDHRYFMFTVIRDPFSRLVSAYVDKLVKAIKAGKPWATDRKCGDHSFESMVETLCTMHDARIEKHFRPQAAFIRNIPMDHIGLFEDLESTLAIIYDRYGIDIEKDVASRVRAPKRTNYSRSDSSPKQYVGDLPAREIALLDHVPPTESFYNDRLRNLVSERYREDLEIYQQAKLRHVGAEFKGAT
jgi:sulfotransferase famil protein